MGGRDSYGMFAAWQVISGALNGDSMTQGTGGKSVGKSTIVVDLRKDVKIYPYWV